jgi:hypothetical protein
MINEDVDDSPVVSRMADEPSIPVLPLVVSPVVLRALLDALTEPDTVELTVPTPAQSLEVKAVPETDAEAVAREPGTSAVVAVVAVKRLLAQIWLGSTASSSSASMWAVALAMADPVPEILPLILLS